jgi:hypothetical protein
MALPITAVTTETSTMASQKHALYKLPHYCGKYVNNQGKRLKATNFNDFSNWEYIAIT